MGWLTLVSDYPVAGQSQWIKSAAASTHDGVRTLTLGVFIVESVNSIGGGSVGGKCLTLAVKSAEWCEVRRMGGRLCKWRSVRRKLGKEAAGFIRDDARGRAESWQRTFAEAPPSKELSTARKRVANS